MTLKTALPKHLDAMANQMDCRDHIKLAYRAIHKSLEIEKEVSEIIEGQMKLRRVRKNEYQNAG